MKAYGLRNKLRSNLIDNHPKKGYINWWEVEFGVFKVKQTERQRGKKEIQKQLLENDNRDITNTDKNFGQQDC